MDCVFCRIAKKEVPAEMVWEDGEMVVFKDINPKAPVHLLIVPREHIESVKDLKDEHRLIVAKLIYVARDVAEKHNLPGYRLTFHVGREGGQIVDHIHLHLLGG